MKKKKKSYQMAVWIALLSALLGAVAKLLEAVAEFFRVFK